MSLPRYSRYKNSATHWLGDVPEHWTIHKFRHIFKESSEKIDDEVVGVMLSVSGYRGIEIKEYDDENRRRLDNELVGYRIVRPGQLVVNTMWLNYAGLGVSEHEGHVSPAYRSYEIAPYLNKRFVHHMMRSESFVQGYTMFLTGIRPNSLQMSRDDLMSFQLVCPPIDEQTAIAKFLDRETAKIDGLISEQERLITLLVEKRQATISQAVTKGLNPNAPMKDSGVEWLGHVPTHWSVVPAKRVASVFVPQRNKPELNEDANGIFWVTMEDVKGGRVVATNLWVSAEACTDAGTRVLKSGAVIASCVGNFGVAAINAADVIINQQLQAYIPKPSEVINTEFLRYLVVNSKSYFESIGTSATLIYVNQQGFGELPLPLPSLDEQLDIVLFLVRELGRLEALTSKAETGIGLLKERRSALISAAVTGKIDVSQAFQQEQTKIQEAA